MSHDVLLQREYYARTASAYNSTHVASECEHDIALKMLGAWLPSLEARKLLDVGAGTGRAQRLAAELDLDASIMGVEPVEALRTIGHDLGIDKDELIAGDATKLTFADNSFDVVMEYGVLHHIRNYQDAVKEMCRVANKGVFISDTNNFGQGSLKSRLMKLALKELGLWRTFDLIRTRGRGYHQSEGDGIFYSFSLFDCLAIIREKFPKVYIFSTTPAKSPNLGFSATHAAILAFR